MSEAAAAAETGDDRTCFVDMTTGYEGFETFSEVTPAPKSGPPTSSCRSSSRALRILNDVDDALCFKLDVFDLVDGMQFIAGRRGFTVTSAEVRDLGHISDIPGARSLSWSALRALRRSEFEESDGVDMGSTVARSGLADRANRRSD